MHCKRLSIRQHKRRKSSKGTRKNKRSGGAGGPTTAEFRDLLEVVHETIKWQMIVQRVLLKKNILSQSDITAMLKS